MLGFLSEVSFNEIVKVLKPKSTSSPHMVYRDELNKKAKSAGKPKLSSDCDAISKPLLLQREEEGKDNLGKRKVAAYSSGINEEKGGIRVKIVMRKEEAARFLSKCKDGKGCLEFKDVAREMAQRPVSHVSIVSLNKTTSSYHKVLDTIPEEI